MPKSCRYLNVSYHASYISFNLIMYPYYPEIFLRVIKTSINSFFFGNCTFYHTLTIITTNRVEISLYHPWGCSRSLQQWVSVKGNPLKTLQDNCSLPPAYLAFFFCVCEIPVFRFFRGARPSSSRVASKVASPFTPIL